MQHVGNDAFIHPLPPLQQAFGQVCHRATIAELRQQDGEKITTMKKKTGTKLNMSRRVLPENNPPKSGASEAAGGAKEKKTNTRIHLIPRFHSVKVNLPIVSSLSLPGGSVRGGNGAGGG